MHSSVGGVTVLGFVTKLRTGCLRVGGWVDWAIRVLYYIVATIQFSIGIAFPVIHVIVAVKRCAHAFRQIHVHPAPSPSAHD